MVGIPATKTNSIYLTLNSYFQLPPFSNEKDFTAQSWKDMLRDIEALRKSGDMNAYVHRGAAKAALLDYVGMENNFKIAKNNRVNNIFWTKTYIGCLQYLGKFYEINEILNKDADDLLRTGDVELCKLIRKFSSSCNNLSVLKRAEQSLLKSKVITQEEYNSSIKYIDLFSEKSASKALNRFTINVLQEFYKHKYFPKSSSLIMEELDNNKLIFIYNMHTCNSFNKIQTFLNESMIGELIVNFYNETGIQIKVEVDKALPFNEVFDLQHDGNRLKERLDGEYIDIPKGLTKDQLIAWMSE